MKNRAIALFSTSQALKRFFFDCLNGNRPPHDLLAARLTSAGNRREFVSCPGWMKIIFILSLG